MCVAVPRSADGSERTSICTIPCERTEDCPHWFQEDGHCEGNVQALCQYEFCQAWCV
jgi:hypothetical protein